MDPALTRRTVPGRILEIVERAEAGLELAAHPNPQGLIKTMNAVFAVDQKGHELGCFKLKERSGLI